MAILPSSSAILSTLALIVLYRNRQTPLQTTQVIGMNLINYFLKNKFFSNGIFNFFKLNKTLLFIKVNNLSINGDEGEVDVEETSPNEQTLLIKNQRDNSFYKSL